MKMTIIIINRLNKCKFKKGVLKSMVCKLRLVVVSPKAKKKQHACTPSSLRDLCSELFTGTAALKFENMAAIA